MLRKFSVVSTGPPILRIHTVGRCGWYPEWQHEQFPGCKLIALPNFFAQHKESISAPSCTLGQFIASSDEVCEQFEAIMQREFVAKLEGERDAVIKAVQEMEEKMKKKPGENDNDEHNEQEKASSFRQMLVLDPHSLQTDHGMNVQFAMFKEAMNRQRDDMRKYFENMRGEFHIKMATLLCEMCPETREMLDEEGASLIDVEARLIREIMLRNREGASAH